MRLRLHEGSSRLHSGKQPPFASMTLACDTDLKEDTCRSCRYLPIRPLVQDAAAPAHITACTAHSGPCVPVSWHAKPKWLASLGGGGAPCVSHKPPSTSEDTARSTDTCGRGGDSGQQANELLALGPILSPRSPVPLNDEEQLLRDSIGERRTPLPLACTHQGQSAHSYSRCSADSVSVSLHTLQTRKCPGSLRGALGARVKRRKRRKRPSKRTTANLTRCTAEPWVALGGFGFGSRYQTALRAPFWARRMRRPPSAGLGNRIRVHGGAIRSFMNSYRPPSANLRHRGMVASH